MKAIEIRYHGATRTQKARLKAWADGCESMIRWVDYSIDVEKQVLDLAEKYLKKLGWNVKMTGFGRMVNGDWVVTIEGIKDENDAVDNR